MRSIADIEVGIREVLRDNKSLVKFLDGLRDFNDLFCKLMGDRADFTLKIEARGNDGRLIHVKVSQDAWQRPEES